MNETFHLGDLLSVTTGRLVSPDHMDGVYRIIDYMTGIPHYTHQLPRAAGVCSRQLLEQHPWLAEIEPPDEFAGKEHVESWLATQVERHGERHDVRPIPPGAYTARDPLAELQEMTPGKPIITVDPSALP